VRALWIFSGYKYAGYASMNMHISMDPRKICGLWIWIWMWNFIFTATLATSHSSSLYAVYTARNLRDNLYFSLTQNTRSFQFLVCRSFMTRSKDPTMRVILELHFLLSFALHAHHEIASSSAWRRDREQPGNSVTGQRCTM